MILLEEDIINVFHVIDTDHNGGISMDEFIKGFNQMFPGMFEGMLQPLFRFSDQDHNGELSIEEFIDLVRFLEKETHVHDPFVMLFDKCDLDENNLLNLSEFILIFRSINPDMDIELIKQLFLLADRDENSVIDFKEYMELVAKLQETEIDEE